MIRNALWLAAIMRSEQRTQAMSVENPLSTGYAGEMDSTRDLSLLHEQVGGFCTLGVDARLSPVPPQERKSCFARRGARIMGVTLVALAILGAVLIIFVLGNTTSRTVPVPEVRLATVACFALRA